MSDDTKPFTTAAGSGKSLKPKRAHPLLEHRLAAERLGWSQVPDLHKVPPYNWTRMASDARAIRNDPAWTGRKWTGTGFRLTGTLSVIDIDVSDKEAGDAILDAIYDLDPDAFEACIKRDSSRNSIALVFQCREPFRVARTRRYTAHPEYLPALAEAMAMPEDGDEAILARKAAIAAALRGLDPQKGEIFGPLTNGRQFQYEGVHSINPDGTERLYQCGEKAPWNTRPDELPYLPASPQDLIDLMETALASRLTLIPEPEPATAAGGTAYDLTPETPFYPKGDSAAPIGELAEGLDPGAEHGVYGCLASTLAGSSSQANCKLYVSHAGRIAVSEFAADIQHYMASDKPGAGYDEAALGAALSRLDAAGNAGGGGGGLDDIPRSDPETTYTQATAWLIKNVAYFTNAFKGRGGVVGITPDSELRELVTVASLRTRMMGFSYVRIGPRGGQQTKHPIDAWLAHPELRVIAGLRMRPELARPLFLEDGLVYLNRYRPPAHPATGGGIAPFMARMERLVPNPAERAWVLNWIAAKVQHPEWRMVGLAMVARQHGAGRGLFAETLQQLFGKDFVISLPYDNISGGSKFNAEIEGKLLVYVNEARHADSHKFGPKNAAREALRVFIEPNHRVPQRIEPKGVDAYYAQIAISTLVLANSIKAAPIDDEDRRTAVVMNGPQMDAAERDEYQAWMLEPANIGALYRHLRDLKIEADRAVFDPFMAPLFVGRDRMIEAGQTDLDRAWAAARDKLRQAADLYAMCQMVALVRSTMRSTFTDLDALVRAHTYEHGCRIGVKRPAEKNWLIRFGDAEDNRNAVFAFDEKTAERATAWDAEQVQKELFKAQKVVDAPGKAFNKALHLVKKEEDEA